MKRVDQTLTDLERALWVVDHSGVAHLLDANSRRSTRGRKREGLDGRLFLTLFIVAAMQGKATIQRMWDIATGQLPRDRQWELGILRRDGDKVVQLTTKQLYDMGKALNKHLAWTGPIAASLSEEERTRRYAVVANIADALTTTTHVVARAGTALAVDESGVWAWTRGRRKPAAAPPVHPSDEDEARVENLADVTTGDVPMPLEAFTHEPADEDFAEDGDAGCPESADLPEAETDAIPLKMRRLDPDATWGVKTHKDGGRTSYFGYALHTLVRIPDVGQTKETSAEPLLIERFRLTPASTDIVDVTIGMIDDVLAAGGKIGDLIGDRHYSYKKAERWAQPLWERGVRLVHDLRKTDHGAVDYQGSKIIAGWPHCPGTPMHLETLVRPGSNGTPEENAAFRAKIDERYRYAMRRHKTVLGDGKSRWGCPALNGKVGCSFVEGSVEAARHESLPIVTPPEAKTAFCKQTTVQIPPGKHMKYAQDEYWGDGRWEASWDRRTYVEGVYGNLKNSNTENIHRGFFQFTGLPMVTLAMTAAVVSYNIRELNNWHQRSGLGDPGHPLLATTEWVNGFTMLTRGQADEIDAADGEPKAA